MFQGQALLIDRTYHVQPCQPMSNLLMGFMTSEPVVGVLLWCQAPNFVEVLSVGVEGRTESWQNTARPQTRELELLMQSGYPGDALTIDTSSDVPRCGCYMLFSTSGVADVAITGQLYYCIDL